MKDRYERGRKEHGEKWDPSDLEAASHLAPHYHSDSRVRVQNQTSGYTRTGRISTTTGWKPAFLLMHRSSDLGSSDVLGPEDRVIATKRGSRYEIFNDRRR